MSSLHTIECAPILPAVLLVCFITKWAAPKTLCGEAGDMSGYMPVLEVVLPPMAEAHARHASDVCTL
jgi:hypothetical protein